MKMETEIYYQMQVKTIIAENTWSEKLTGLSTRDEDIPPPKNDQQAIELAKKTIQFFNETLRVGEIKRVLHEVQRVEKKVINLL